MKANSSDDELPVLASSNKLLDQSLFFTGVTFILFVAWMMDESASKPLAGAMIASCIWSFLLLLYALSLQVEGGSSIVADPSSVKPSSKATAVIKDSSRNRRWWNRLHRDGIAWGGPGLTRLAKKAAKERH